MTDASKELANVKQMVRSLLISSPVELPVGQLLKDYHSFIGKPLDFRSLGYTTPENFFRDISDTVNIEWKYGTMVLRGVANEKTKHIENLVQRQKKPNKKKRISYYREPQRRSYDNRGPRFYSGGFLPKPKMVPAYVRNQISNLFRSYKDGLYVRNFEEAFSRRYGCQINFTNYGFNSWDEFLDSVKDIVTMKEFPNGEWGLVPVGYSVNYNSQGPLVAKENIPENNSVKTYNAEQEDLNSTRETTRMRHPSKGRGRRRIHSGNSDTTVGRSSSGSNDIPKYTNSQDKLDLEIQQVLEDKPDGVWACKFSEEFQAKHGRPLDYTQHGFLSVIEFVSSSNCVHIERPTPTGDWKLYDARIPRKQEDQSEDLRLSRQKTFNTLEIQTKEAMQILLKDYPHGISMKEFPSFYKSKMDAELPIKELGYESADQYFLSLADSVLQISYVGEGVIMMYSVDVDISQLGQIPSLTVDKPLPTGNPVDAIGPGCHYTPVMCPNTLEYTGLFVSNIINPGLFWVILRHKHKALALEQLMNDIDVFYNSLSSEEYALPESLAVPGQVCATLFPEDNNWHRGIITKVNEEGFAAIYYVDYGNTAYIHRKAIKFLKSDFLLLPAQAIQSRLANIVPSGDKWKVKSRNRMLELVKDRPLVAFVTKVRSQVLSLCLTDTSDPSVDIHINDILATEGHARFLPDDEIPEHVTKDQHKDVPDYCHVFGWNVKPAPRLPEAAGVSTQLNVNNSAGKTPEYCYVKWLQLTKGRIIHLINLERTAYVVSAELSSFIWEEDILSSMLRKRNIVARKRTVNSDDYPQLFQDLAKYNVKSFSIERLSTMKLVVLYELSSVPEIMCTFLAEETELVDAIIELMAKFDPDSPYWKTEESAQDKEDVTPLEQNDMDVTPQEQKDMNVSQQERNGINTLDEDSQEMEETVDLSIEEKQMLLQALQFKRKRYLQTLMSSPDSSVDLVNQLNNCESDIMLLKQQLVDQKQTGLKQTKTVGHEDTRSQPTAVNFSQSQVYNPQPKKDKFLIPSQIKSYPGMMGIPTGSQQPGIPYQMCMLQQGIMANPRMNNIHNINTMMGTSGNMSGGMVPGLPQPQINSMYNAQLPVPGNMTFEQRNMPPMGGRGQPFGILPGLMPLFQNLTVGRGRGGQ